MSEQHAAQLHKILRMRDLPNFVGLEDPNFRTGQSGQFPKPISLSDTGAAVGWLEADLIAWQASCIGKRNSRKARGE